jgi:RNA polymerase sigma factor (sigma-70 family)
VHGVEQEAELLRELAPDPLDPRQEPTALRLVNERDQSITEFEPDQIDRRLSDKGFVDRYDSLSEREREIFQLVAEGNSTKEVAELLSVSPATVETHRAHILQKLELHITAELVLYAVRRGVIA